MPTAAECAVFHQKFKDVENSIEAIHRDMVSQVKELRADFSDHVREQMERHVEYIEAQRMNTLAINNLTTSTGDLIEVWQSVTGAIKLFTKLAKLVVLAGGVVGGGAAIVQFIPF